MLKKPFTLENTLYTLALAIALGIRFINLGALSLTDYEARFALEALNITNGMPGMLGSNPDYTHLTTILFYILGGADFWARFWPALAGACLVIAPWFLRERIGRVPALVLAFGLALDPGMNAISRLAGGPMLAISFLVLAGVLWLDNRPIPAGIFAGLGILAGPSAWFGLLSFLLAQVLFRLLPEKFMPSKVPGANDTGSDAPGSQTGTLKDALPWGIGTLLVLGSLMAISPQGLAACVRSFLEFTSGWWQPSGIPFWRVLLALPAYELLPLLFGLIHLVRGFLQKDRISTWLSIWLLVSILLATIYPGRQVSDLCWALVPLWLLAAKELGRHFDFSQANRWVVGGTITALFILLVLAWLTLTRISTYDPASTEVRLQWLFIGGILLVIPISLIMVSSGWSSREAKLGGTWGALIPLILFTIGVATGSAGLRDPRTIELWNPEPRLGRSDLVLKVINEISFLNAGFEEALPIKIIAVDSPALDWLFHKWEVEKSDIFDPMQAPEIIITSQLTELDLTSEYRGEPIVWREMSSWDEADYPTWLQWFLYRQMSTQQEKIVLWVRSDLMLEAQDSTTP
jgi:hypothetical protein